jgi:hypothetical protein
MTKKINTIEQQVMGSVAAVYAARRFANPFMLKVYALVLSAAGIMAFVSLSHVGANFLAAQSHGAPAVSTFVFSAVTKTTLIVQCALAVGAFAFISLVLDATRSIRTTSFRQGRAA